MVLYVWLGTSVAVSAEDVYARDLAQSYASTYMALKLPWPSWPHQPTFKVEARRGCRPRRLCPDKREDWLPQSRNHTALYEGSLCSPQQHTVIFCSGIPNTDLNLTYPATPAHTFPVLAVHSPDCDTVAVEERGGGTAYLMVSELRRAWVLRGQPPASLEIKRPTTNTTLTLWIGEWDSEPEQQVWPPLKHCLEPPPFSFNLQRDPMPRAVTLGAWVTVYSAYLMALLLGVWETFPALSVMSQALLLTSHAPLLMDLSYTWYMVGSLLASALPLLVLCMRVTHGLSKNIYEFTLPSRTSVRGAGYAFIFFVCHMGWQAIGIKVHS